MNEFLALYYRRIAGRYQRVADTMHGDAGLEGFGSDGVAYQSYCDVDSDTASDRSRKQKKKITSDLKKLKKYSSFWKTTLQDLKICRWVLMVPSYEDKEVLKHGRKKAAELRQEKLKFLSNTFDFAIETAEDYPLECQELRQQGVAPIPIEPASIDGSQVSSFRDKSPNEFNKIRQKLIDGELVEDDDELVFDFVEWLLRRDHALERLREIDPDLHTKLDERRMSLARTVKTRSLYNDGPSSGERVTQLVQKLQDEFGMLVPGLKAATLEELAHGQIASWLAECPLRFK